MWWSSMPALNLPYGGKKKIILEGYEMQTYFKLASMGRQCNNYTFQLRN